MSGSLAKVSPPFPSWCDPAEAADPNLRLLRRSGPCRWVSLPALAAVGVRAMVYYSPILRSCCPLFVGAWVFPLVEFFLFMLVSWWWWEAGVGGAGC